MSRSYKYHRPRGLLTASYHDPGCFFQVGDEPNVRGAHRLAEPGMDVRSQNTWPSLGFDVKAANQLAGRFLGPASTTRPSSSRSACGRPTSGCSSGSCTPGRSRRTRPGSTVDKRYAHPDVLVAGGGPAGMAAAVAAARPGRR